MLLSGIVSWCYLTWRCRKCPKVTSSVLTRSPPELFDDIDFLSKTLGVSRSAFLTSLLTQPCADLRALIGDIDIQDPETALKRFRGSSMDLVHERVEQLKGMDNDLFSNSNH